MFTGTFLITMKFGLKKTAASAYHNVKCSSRTIPSKPSKPSMRRLPDLQLARMKAWS